MAKKNKNAQPLNKTIPGGYYIGVNGKPHDAHGKPIGDAAEEAEKETEKQKGEGDNTNPPQD